MRSDINHFICSTCWIFINIAVVDQCFLHIPYLPVYNAHFFFVKLTFKFAMRIVHESHCLPKFSLTYHKQKLHTSWFSITLIKKLPMKSV